MDVLHHDLETVEKLGFGVLNFRDEVLGQILVHDAIRRREEREHVLDEVPLVVIQFAVPIHDVSGQINFLRRPKTRF